LDAKRLKYFFENGVTMRKPEEFGEPLSRLFSFGKPRSTSPKLWRDYIGKLGLGRDLIPALIEIAADWASVESEDEDKDDAGIWAPIHAWRALGQLGAVKAVEPLLRIMDPLDDVEDEWYQEDFPEVFCLIGPAAIPQLLKYFEDQENLPNPRLVAESGLAKIAKQYPETREEILLVFREVFSHYEENDEDFNSLMICDLLDLKAIDMAEMIRDAFAAGRVDEFCVMWEEVEEALGPLAIEPPPKTESLHGLTPADFADLFYPEPIFFLGDDALKRKKKKQQKAKAKKKQQEKSKKGNRKKK
jgi:hypothetical protein